jgi:hypothetical protein
MAGTAFSTANWGGYDEATVSNPDSALTDFTLIIDISDLSNDWAGEVQADGADIRVTKGDDTEIPYDLIDWDYNSGDPTGLIRCKWSSTLASSGTQKVRVWAGYTGGTATAYSDNETYGADNAYDSDTWGYWPLHDANDRTSNGRTLTGAGSLSFGGGTGHLGDATTFDDSSSQYAHTDGVTANPSSAHSVVGLFKVDDTAGDSGYFGAVNSESPFDFYNNYQIWFDNASPDRVGLYNGSSAVYGSTNPSTDWTHVGITSNGSNDIDLYVNGARETGIAGNFADTDLYEVAIGVASNKNLSGLAQHVYRSSVQRSADWIAHEYDQTNDNATFWGSWTWTAQAGGGISIPVVMHHRRMIGVS